MSKLAFGINITEKDSTVLTLTDTVTDTVVVLIDKTKLIEAEQSVLSKYTSLSDFTKNYSDSSYPVTVTDDTRDKVTPVGYIKSLLGVGWSVLIVPVDTSAISLDSMKTELSNKLVYDPRFIVSAIEPTLSGSTYSDATVSLYEWMAGVAADRGDVVAVLDQPTSSEFKFTMETLVEKATNLTNSKLVQVAGFLGDPVVGLPSGVSARVPASLAYLLGYMKVQNSGGKPYTPMAGVHIADSLSIKSVVNEIPGTTAEKVYNQDSHRTNPIIQIGKYGYTIYGNATAVSFTQSNDAVSNSVVSQLSCRLAINYVKKAIYDICNQLTFSPNVQWIWTNFRSQLAAVLDDMVSNFGLYDYDIQVLPTTEDILRYKLKARVILGVQRSVEKFDIEVSLSDDTIEVKDLSDKK